ncbi:NB-ARC domain-containing protein [Streptomyces rubradiris]|uniref:NB-ARC domain-containing protein n=1 Tax=Streptomyces rubradiris TaxID=285531 RepID=UPI0036EF3492
MEAEILALAGMGASSLVTLALQDLWGWGRRRFATLLGRGAPADEAAAEEELERSRRELLDARRAGDEDTAVAVEEAWAERLRDLLASHPESGNRLREVVAATIERSPAPVALGHILHYVNHVPVFQAMNDHWARCTEARATTAMFLCGLPGVGKRTTLRRWLQSHRDELPGELLQADLARDERGRPADPAAVLEHWLAQLGVAREDRPADTDAKAALVRRQLRDRPAVLVLENVGRPAEIKPLLPDSAGHVVLMTGQRVPLGLDALLDFEPVEIAPLKDEHALELLLKVSRSTEHPDRLRPIVRHLGGLPLALRLVAGQLRTPVPGTLEDITARLADRTTRWELLAVDDTHDLPGALDLAYERLGADAALLYRRLGTLPRTDIHLDTVHALTPDREPATARRGLHELLSARLLERDGVDTYRLHPLVHDHAAARAEREDTDAERDAVTGWFVRHLRQTAEAAEAALSSRWRHDPGHAYPDVPRTPEQGARAERELARRRDGLLAAVRLAHATGRYEEAWRLCQALWTFCLRTGSHAEWIESHETGLAAARAGGDRLAVARMHFQLGFARLDRWSLAEDDPRRAREHLDAARESVRGDGTGRGEGEARTESSALEALGLLELKLNRPRQALDLLAGAETALGDLAHPRGRALLAYHKGAAYTALGRHDDAERTLREARERFRRLGDGPDIALNVGKSWLRYAQDRLACARPEEALRALDEAAAAIEKGGSGYFLAVARLLRGDVHRRLGDERRAAADWAAAGTLFAQARSPRAEEARRRLGNSPVRSADGELD